MAGFEDSHRRWLGAALIGLAGSACSGERPSDPPRPLPNVALILIDTLRPDHLQPYGYEAETSPFLDRLAERSVVFEHARSTSSWTAPSTASVFTGLYPNEHGVVAGFRAQHNLGDEPGERSMQLVALPEGQLSVPRLFRELGYRTLGLASNINIGSELGFDRDFAEFELLHKASAEELVGRAVDWRRALAPGQPYFLYLHLNDVHKPYEGRPGFGYDGSESAGAELDEAGLVANDVAAYDSEIRYLDHWLEQLFEQLDWNGAEGENTVILLISDHGEEFRDHGGWGHRFSLHAEVNDVLMMVSAPGAAAGQRVSANVSLIDVLPTLVDFTGGRLEDGGRGRSLRPLVLDPSAGSSPEFAERALFAHRIRGRSPKPLAERPPLWAVVSGRWKLLFNGSDESFSLFDVAADPRELEDLAEARPEVVARLREQLDDFRAGAILRAGAEVQVPIDEELYKHLEELGYAGDE